MQLKPKFDYLSICAAHLDVAHADAGSLANGAEVKE